VKVNARETCHYDVQEEEIFFGVGKKPCPDPRENDKGGSARETCHYDVQEKEIFFGMGKEPCPDPRGNDKGGRGTVTGSESELREICADEKLVVVVETCGEVACFHGNHVGGSVSRIAAA